MNKIKLAIFITALLACVSASAMPMLNFDTNGQLVSANGVEVGGTLYNVEFLDGACVGLFDGCNEPGDFAFTTQATAIAAAEALLAQVFLDTMGHALDGDPSLTRGCENQNTRCDSIIPWEAIPDANELFQFVVAQNHVLEEADTPRRNFVAKRSADFTFTVNTTFAHFDTQPSTIAEPATLSLLALACAGMGWRMRRRT